MAKKPKPTTVQFTIRTDRGTVTADCPVIRRAVDDSITYDADPLMRALIEIAAQEPHHTEVTANPNVAPHRTLDRLGLTVLRRPARWLGAWLNRV